ncbi:MAG: valine--tRNA ligase [Chloroflexi bacterium]|nr:valine--tRNA ligase [Chloroflexota bacterium]
MSKDHFANPAPPLPKRYHAPAAETRWQQAWDEQGIYHFVQDSRPVYAIDTPPPTVSGDLHLGHCYSYSQTDFMARFWRMNGYNVYYPMGWDDNGLPTERLVERSLGIKPAQVGRAQFIQAILEVSREYEARYEQLWRRLGLSVDWRYTYSTISPPARRIAQYSFIDLYRKGLAYRASAPAIWCPQCGTAIAQAEVDDLERETRFVTVAFALDDGQPLPIATTRPELLPACVAVFVHPDDARYRALVGRTAITPLFDRPVPILADDKADPAKGTGVVMCCTFGDTTDVEWWYKHDLPLISVIRRDGALNELAGPYAGLDTGVARARITADLTDRGLILGQHEAAQTVRVHERCDTPVEYIDSQQWFIRLLDHRAEFLQAGCDIAWHPAHMHARYEDWVRNLAWDWCISRQRYFGVPFPVWYCADCGTAILADPADLPVDPLDQPPPRPCDCGCAWFVPEEDVMDTWATSSLSPQVAGRWLEDPALFEQVFPMSLRPHAHEIIRTWTFYTIVKSWYHLGRLPWSNIVISGYGLAPEGGKVSKSRGAGPLDPLDMMERYSADAVRYWAASTRLGRDSVIDETKIAAGQRLVTKLWNVTRFAHTFLAGYQPPPDPPALLPADRWLLSRLHRVIQAATTAFADYDYTAAKDEAESFFWDTLADNYLELSKVRLYELDDGDPRREAARYALYHALLTVVKLLAPILPHITEEVYQLGLARPGDAPSIHVSPSTGHCVWPQPSDQFISDPAEAVGRALVGIATAVRRYKSTRQLPLSAPLARLEIVAPDPALRAALRESLIDLRSVTRAQAIEISDTPGVSASPVPELENLWVTIDE